MERQGPNVIDLNPSDNQPRQRQKKTQMRTSNRFNERPESAYSPGDAYASPAHQVRCESIRLPVAQAHNLTAQAKITKRSFDYSSVFMESGYVALIDAAFADFSESRHPFFKGKSELQENSFWRLSGAEILADMPRSMLQALLDGSLPQKVENQDQPDNQLREYFDDSKYPDDIKAGCTKSNPPAINPWVLRSKQDSVPAFYVRCFIDDIGHAPTPRQLRTAIACMRQYVSGNSDYDNLCVRIDNESRANRSDEDDINQGLHHFLAGSTERVENIITFCTALESVLDDLLDVQVEQTQDEQPQDQQIQDEQAQNRPVPFMLTYVGYTGNESNRTRQHESGGESHLKSLFESVCRMNFRSPDDVPIFKWETYIIGYPVSPDECKMGEELYCQITQSYYNGGLGFNIAPAGLSTDSTKKLSQDECKRLLSIRENNVMFVEQLTQEFEEDFLRYGERVKREIAEQAERRKRLDQEHAQLKEEAAQLKRDAISKEQSLAVLEEFREEQRKLEDSCTESQQDLRTHLERHHKDVIDHGHEYIQEVFKEQGSE
ncbi:hypothetical protein GMOD_00006619 [Pyrenophora seminiperda CCB06]|uniref:Uncharacterized protein n=1 Tax=Pyrenophora seminiperda CCB06 TaxID=1302712 RepID=A0A3M7MAU8_9PLEO|nr:hypothetical protein GMOD_00006619 [Pyrenophora seminiperda CCB06]